MIASRMSLPASLLTASRWPVSGFSAVKLPTTTTIRVRCADGRAAHAVGSTAPRRDRWESLCATRGPDGGGVVVPRSSSCARVADGPTSSHAALDAGVEGIASAGLEHCPLVAAARPDLPRDPDVDRPAARAYRSLLETALTAGQP
jgi:hypothetical protein